MHTDPDAPPKWVRWLWEVDASEAAEEREGGKVWVSARSSARVSRSRMTRDWKACRCASSPSV